MKHYKAQAATEYLIMGSFVIGAAVIIFYYTMFFSSESIAVNQAQETVETLAKAIDYVYALGPETQTFVEIDIPSSAVECAEGKVICTGGGEVLLKISSAAGVSDVYATTEAGASGGIAYTTGRYYVLIKNTESGVEIGP